jgi:hypothetical protein
MAKFKSIAETTPINPLPTGAEIVALIERELADEGELESSMDIARRLKTNGFNIALTHLLEVIKEHRHGIKDINEVLK